MWENLPKSDVDKLIKFHNRYPEHSKIEAHAPNLEHGYPNGIFYRRACEMMGIDPANNPNYKYIK